MLTKAPGLETLVATNDYGLSNDEVKRRRIDRASYDRFFIDRLSRIRLESIGVAQSAMTDYFKRETFSSLSPANAAGACDRNSTALLQGVNHRRWKKSAHDILKDQCSFNVKQYQERVVSEEANRVARTYLAAPATIDGLRANNWFSVRGVSLAGIPRQYQRGFLNQIEQRISAHKEKAVSAALRTVRSTYRAAVPYQPTENEFLKLCNILRNSKGSGTLR